MNVEKIRLFLSKQTYQNGIIDQANKTGSWSFLVQKLAFVLIIETKRGYWLERTEEGVTILDTPHIDIWFLPELRRA